MVSQHLIEVKTNYLASQHAYRSARRAAAIERNKRQLLDVQRSRLEVSWELAKERQLAQEAQLRFAAALEAKDVAIANLVSRLTLAQQENMDMSMELTSLRSENIKLASHIAEVRDRPVRSIGVVTSQKRRSIGTLTVAGENIRSSCTHCSTDDIDQCLIHLNSVKVVIENALVHLSSAAEVANSTDESFPKGSLQDRACMFLRHYYVLLDPKGIRERDEDNERSDLEMADMKLNRLGHLFTFDRINFWQSNSAMPENLRRELEQFAVHHTPLSNADTSSFYDYESMYIHRESMAYSWQEAYQDSELVILFALLSRIA